MPSRGDLFSQNHSFSQVCSVLEKTSLGDVLHFIPDRLLHFNCTFLKLFDLKVLRLQLCKFPAQVMERNIRTKHNSKKQRGDNLVLPCQGCQSSPFSPAAALITTLHKALQHSSIFSVFSSAREPRKIVQLAKMCCHYFAL